MTLRLDVQGRMLNGTKRGPKGHVCVWNGNLCTKSGGKFWFGDIDLDGDESELVQIAKDKGEDVYVLHEMDCRFDTAANPRFENAAAVIHPDGTISRKDGLYQER